MVKAWVPVDRKTLVTELKALQGFDKANRAVDLCINECLFNEAPEEITLRGMETFTNGLSVHKVLDIYYKFIKTPEGPRVTFYFPQKDFLTALKLTYGLLEDEYGWDERARLVFKGNAFDWKTIFPVPGVTSWSDEVIIEILTILASNDASHQQWELRWSNTEEGENAYLYNKQLLTYQVLDTEEDDFFLNIEWARWGQVLGGTVPELSVPTVYSQD